MSANDQFTLGATAFALTTLSSSATGKRVAMCTVQTAAARVLRNGTPTASVGTPYAANDTFYIALGDIGTTEMIAQAGTPVIDVEYDPVKESLEILNKKIK